MTQAFLVGDAVEIRNNDKWSFDMGAGLEDGKPLRGVVAACLDERAYSLLVRVNDDNADRELYPLYSDNDTGIQYDWSFTGDGRYVADEGEEPVVFHITD